MVEDAAYYWYPNQMQYINTNEAPVHQYAVSAGGYISGLTIDCNQPIYTTHSSPVNYHTPPHVPVYPEIHETFSPISPLTPLSTSSLSPPPSENCIAPSVCSRTSENVCPYKGCGSTGKFKRRTDLVRHIRTQHEAEKHKTNCKHAWCGRTGDNGFSRLDHYREHLREVHREEIPYKTRRGSNSRSSTKSKNRSKVNATSAPRQIFST
ncbi:MAG: hypothetical protein GOMPHAMPRED_006613 [Gomphillus americanus]|uniref:C2H2-type domain-containing protein n=1 Tax=Gomphillus americanus TaxID=1940652 RepID=A0A8H3IYG7_9LECA|nr:MAG: hypothetical protein GOMPHAMPRED_006613 [Gomphillus americanus]